MSTVEDLDRVVVASRHLTVVPDAPADDAPDADQSADAVPVGFGPAVVVDHALWTELGALAPEVARRRRQPGRRRRDDRAVLEGILHVLATGIAWRELPQELGCGSGVTCWRRLREWVDAGTWATIEPRLRAAVDPALGLDWARPWAGAGRPTDAPAGTAPVLDPGATAQAIDRRVAWAGPSLI